LRRTTQIKLIVVAVLALIAVVLLYQNRQTVQTRVLFATIEMPRAVLLLVTLAIGFAGGLVTAGVWARKK